MTEIVFFRNNKKKTNKISQISYFFPTLFLVHRKVRCPPKVLPNPTSNHIYIYMVELHQLVTVGKKIWFWNFWDLDTKWPGHLWLIIEH